MSILQSLRAKLISVYKTVVMLTPSGQLYELELAKMWGLHPQREANPLTRKPYKFFSQSDDPKEPSDTSNPEIPLRDSSSDREIASAQY